jgi:hypothetical protein
VDGIALRIGWNAVNTAEDVYDWSYFDTEIPKAVAAGKKVSLLVVDGGNSLPSWVMSACTAAGEPTFSFYQSQNNIELTIPVFWSPTLLAKKAKLMAAFGAKYNSNPAVTLIKVQFAGARNDDWNIPADAVTVDGIPPAGSTQVSRWLADGYTTAKMVAAGNQVITNAMNAFPSKAVAMAIGSNNTALDPAGNSYLAQTVISTARSTYGNRMVATHNSMSEKPPVPPLPPGDYWSVIYNMRPAVGGQMLWRSYSDSACHNAENGAPCDAATVLTNSVERAYEYGWNYLEIYSADIVGLTSVIHYAHMLLRQSSPTPDFVLYNPRTYQTAVWYMNNNVFTGAVFGPTLPAGWSLVNLSDFNGDGNRDYALFNPSTRQTAIWYLSGVTFVGGAYGPTLPSGWTLVATRDFNRDGKPDYVLYNASTRQTALWYMHNNALIGGGYGPTFPVGWRLVGVADFNHDGHTDYALFNSGTSQTAIWYLSGVTFVSSSFGPTIARGYELKGTADFNGNAKPDYLLYNPSTRRTALWYLNNNLYTDGAFGPTLPAGWNLVAP